MIINKIIEKDRELDAFVENGNIPFRFKSVDELFKHWDAEDKRRGIIEKILDFFYFELWCRCQDIYFYLKQRLIRKHHIVKTTLKAGRWHNTDTRMLYANMALFEQFIKNEDPYNTINYKFDVEYREVYKKMKKIEKWWKNYENRLKAIDKAEQLWYDSSIVKINNLKALKKISQMEQKLIEEEQEMLHLLIDIRNYLST